MNKYLCLECFHGGIIAKGELCECSECGSTILDFGDKELEEKLEADARESELARALVMKEMAEELENEDDEDFEDEDFFF